MRTPPHHRSALPALALLAAAAGFARAQTATFSPIPHGVDTFEFYPISISNDGQFVGGYLADDFGVPRGFRWSSTGGLLQFPDLCPIVPATRLFQLSGSGNAAVGEMNWCDQDPGCPGCGETGSGIWTEDHGTTYIGLLPGGISDMEASIAMDVSYDGSVAVGYSITPDPDTGDFTLHGYRWTRDGGMQDLDAVPDSQYSRAVGVSDDGQTILVDALMLFTDGEGQVVATPDHAYLWREGQGFQQIPIPDGFAGMSASAISADGTTVVGYVGTALGVTPVRSEVFRWRADTGTVVLGARPDLGRPFATAWGVSGDGSVIVGDLSGGNPRIPYIWDEDHGFRPVTQVLTDGGADFAGWEIRSINATSADGRTFVGWGFREHPDYGTIVDGWIATVADGGPECPADWDASGQVNSNDISAFLSAWLDSVQNGNLNADFDQSGSVNSNDISAFLSAWLDAVQNGC